MKKIFGSLAFVALLSLVFVSCGDDDENPLEVLTGKMEITVDGKSENFSAVYFQYQGDKTRITAGTQINIIIDGKSAGEYTLGLGRDANTAANEIVSNGISAINSGNAVAYTPSISDAQTSVYGLLTLTEVTNIKLTGSFSVTVAELSNLINLDLTSILSVLNGSTSKKIEGTFTAVSYTN